MNPPLLSYAARRDPRAAHFSQKEALSVRRSDISRDLEAIRRIEGHLDRDGSSGMWRHQPRRPAVSWYSSLIVVAGIVVGWAALIALGVGVHRAILWVVDALQAGGLA